MTRNSRESHKSKPKNGVGVATDLVSVVERSETEQRIGFHSWSTLGTMRQAQLCMFCFMGIMKEKHQFDCNFILYFVPLTRLGWHNVKDWIMKHSEGK